MIRIPRPEVNRAFLVNAKTRVPTPHVYVETIECTLPMRCGNEGGEPVGGPAWQFLFQCEVTGLQRVWGAENRITFNGELVS